MVPGEHGKRGPREHLAGRHDRPEGCPPGVRVKKNKGGQSLKRERKEGRKRGRREIGRDHMVSEGQGQVKGHGAYERAPVQAGTIFASRCVV